MPISGTVPNFSVSLEPEGGGVSPTLVTITGGDTGLPDGSSSTESLAAFYQRAINALTCSGTLDTGEQRIPAANLSGIRAIQRELAYRLADLTGVGEGETQRLVRAQEALAASGEVQFGS